MSVRSLAYSLFQIPQRLKVFRFETNPIRHSFRR
jgi:hypothetical protein